VAQYILFGLALILMERIWSWLRLKHLKSCQRKVSIDYGKEVTLRPALWAYSLEISLFILFVWIQTGLHYPEGRIVSKLIMLVFTLIIMLIPVGLLVIHLRSRVVIGAGRQMRYFVGKYCRTLHFDQITKYRCDSYYYYITRKDGYTLKIPASFKHSEIIMAFLENAVAHDGKKSAHK
jgi:hypothetical protein